MNRKNPFKKDKIPIAPEARPMNQKYFCFISAEMDGSRIAICSPSVLLFSALS
jgi:hypothetical protein